jgi:methylmalonyl-CoA/ethylmalonyl-CoA epimerase
LKIDHVSIAVKDLEKAKRFISNVLLGTYIKEVELHKQNAKAVYFLINDIVIGIEAPLSKDSPIHTHIEKKGEGIHHIAFNVSELGQLRKELEEEGVRIVGEQDIKGVRDEFFTHPKSSLGLLIQLMKWKEPYGGSLQKRLEHLGEE